MPIVSEQLQIEKHLYTGTSDLSQMEVKQKAETLAYTKKWLDFWIDFVSFFIPEKNPVFKNPKWDII